ncbi:hypothetical protein Avbf_18340 [Armadillidium vulgare]|nr:hypothetical protein Avbf_18340 [Armadillidium vulgare]
MRIQPPGIHCMYNLVCITNQNLHKVRMESENFQFHESGEILTKVCMEKILRKILESFFYFVSFVKGKISKISDLQERKKELENLMILYLFMILMMINFEDLKANSKSYFGLPYYFDYYTKSLSCLSNDKDLKEAELEGLLFCTNAGIEDSLGCISKREILNEGLFRNSERKRLANELASYVMQNKVIHLESMIKDDSFSLILKFSEMLLNHVFDVKKIDFRKRKKKNKKLYHFRNEFFESLFDYQEKFPNPRKENSKKFKSLFPTDKKDTEGFIEFLGEKTITIKISKNSEYKSLKILSEELVLSVMLEKPFDIKANIHDQKILQKLNKFIRKNVIDLKSKKLKETFLSDNSKSNKEVHNFRQCFFEDLKKFCNAFKDKNDKEIEELVKVYNSHSKQEGENEVIEFLKQKEIRFAEFPEAVVDIFPSGEVDTTEIDKNILEFLNLITFAVNQNNFDNLISNEMNKLITKSEDQILLQTGFNNITDTWHNEGALSLNIVSKLKYRKWFTEKELN